MKMKVMLMVAMLAFSGVALAQPKGDHNNDGHPDCGQGGCLPGDGGNGGGNSGGNGGGNSDATAVGVGIGVGVATSTSVAASSASSTAAAVNNNTVSNSATGGNATATGGEGGTAVSAAVVESGAVTVAEGAVQSNMNYTYKEVQQAPAIGQGSFAINGCSVGGNAGGSWTGGAAFLGFGWTPDQCYDFMLAQAYQSLGEKKAACDILRNTDTGKRAEKRGVVLPGCEPEVKTVVVPAPVDAVTHEELNRAFKASQSK